MTEREKHIRISGIIICELFTVITIFSLLSNGQSDRLLLAFGTLVLVLIPELVEHLFKCKIALPTYLFALFYAIGPMLGHCHNLYYTLPWWDKMLHITGGVMFAFLGIFIYEKFAGKTKNHLIMVAAFALCFSMAISAAWEFVEYGADLFLGTDMQDDTVVTHITSYMLGSEAGVTGYIGNIDEVIINGERLPVDGYIDIGLHDTMTDMLLESLGALVVAVIYILDKGKHVVCQMREQVTGYSENENIEQLV